MNAEQASGRERPVLMMRTLVRGLAWDVGLPLAAYYVLHLAGATDWVALLTATGAAGCRLLWTALKRHSLNPFAMLMVIIFGLCLSSLVTRGFSSSRTRLSPVAWVFRSSLLPRWDIP
ncbi:hypothetical protein ACX801_17435 [Arthrobacter bambusae]